LESYLKHLVSSQSADYLEIRLEETQETRLTFRGPTLDTVGESLVAGGSVRALVDGGWGFVSFNRLEGLEEKVALAVKQAGLAGRRRSEPSRLAPVPAVTDRVTPPLGEDPRSVSLSAKKDILQAYNRRVLDFGPPIATSRVIYVDRWTNLRFANSDGTYLEQEKLDLAGMVEAVAVRGGDTQTMYTGFGSSSSFDVVRGLEEKVDDTCRRAAALLDAPVVRAGEYPVILDPMLAGLFIHEAFGHLSEGDNVYENPRLQKVMTLGRRFGGSHLNVYDDGTMAGSRGYLRYDDEGVPTEKTYLIREGVLVGRLHSRETASKMGERPTGNARALDYRFAPICRMRTTAIAPGEASFEDLLEGVSLGIYARDTMGGETAGEMFTFSAADAVMIRDGKPAETVRGVNLTGNIFDTLANIDLIGRDFHVRPMSCGRGAQSPARRWGEPPHQDLAGGGRGEGGIAVRGPHGGRQPGGRDWTPSGSGTWLTAVFSLRGTRKPRRSRER